MHFGKSSQKYELKDYEQTYPFYDRNLVLSKSTSFIQDTYDLHFKNPHLLLSKSVPCVKHLVL